MSQACKRRFGMRQRAEDLRVEQVPVPTIDDPHAVKVNVVACGICGTP